MALIIGVSALLRVGDRFLFEVQTPGKWRRRPDGLEEIGVGCIGGRLEPRETPREALEREVREEIGCGVEIEASASPFLVDPRGTVRRLKPREAPDHACFLWEKARGGADFIPGGRVVVYRGVVIGDPAPVALPATLEIPLAMLRDLAAGRTAVQDAVDRGATVRERQPLPRRARLRLVDTALVVADVLGRAPQLLGEVRPPGDA
jgi:8-oxo-dGTP pyrophosphatase MutT (NUDIX family)